MRSKSSLDCLKNILNEFAKISGLHANLQKTVLIPIGTEENVEFLNDTGMIVSNTFTLLGCVIDNKLEKLHDNFEKVIAKMLNVVNFWHRFNLTLPGRMAIANTFLLSLLNHIGCFLTPLPDQLDRMQNLYNNFCIGKLNISKNRYYSNPRKGGGRAC